MQQNSRPARLLPSGLKVAADTASRSFDPIIHNTPAIPAVDWSLIGQSAPQLPTTPAGELPTADVIVITWASSEWAALQHVFCSSTEPMPYSNRTQGTWPGWQKYDKDLPTSPDPEWTYWGYYRLAIIGTKRVLLFKSNTHLDYPGPTFLTNLINIFLNTVKPGLLLSIGTAGGTVTTDHLGTVRVVHAGTLYQAGQPSTQWQTYSNAWQAGWQIINSTGFNQLLFPIPTTLEDLSTLTSQFNTFYNTSYTLADFNAGNLDMGDPLPVVQNMTGTETSLLTTGTFLVADNAGNYEQYACVEMDDAIIAEACEGSTTLFGFVRNISDPVQNAALPADIQGSWSSAIYDAYGLYTSYNGALTTWAILCALA